MDKATHQTPTNPKTRIEEIPFKDFVRISVDFLKNDKICIMPTKEKFDKVVTFIEHCLNTEEYQFHWAISAKESRDGIVNGRILATSIDVVPGYEGKQFFLVYAV